MGRKLFLVLILVPLTSCQSPAQLVMTKAGWRQPSQILDLAVAGLGLPSSYMQVIALGDCIGLAPSGIEQDQERRRVRFRVASSVRGSSDGAMLEFDVNPVVSGAERNRFIYGHTVGGKLTSVTWFTLPGTEIVEALDSLLELNKITEHLMRDSAWRDLKEFLLRRMGSSSPTIARAATVWLMVDGPYRKLLLKELSDEDIKGLVRLAKTLNPVEELRFLKGLGDVGKKDVSADMAGFLAVLAHRAPVRHYRPSINAGMDEPISDEAIEDGIYHSLSGFRTLRGKIDPEPIYALASSLGPEDNRVTRFVMELGDPRAEKLLIAHVKAGRIAGNAYYLGNYHSRAALAALVEAYKPRGAGRASKAARAMTTAEERTDSANEEILRSLEKMDTKEAREALGQLEKREPMRPK